MRRQYYRQYLLPLPLRHASHSASLTVTVDTQIAINNIELVNDSGIPNDNLTNNVRPHFQV
ncbi:hypothetical protein KU710_23345, partial [Salmonella enterica subsp. enterica serovar Give]|nr:hypothetical protein [Salmonella enterica subsp. enterica serovar Give]